MKLSNNPHRSLKLLAASALLTAGWAMPAQALNIAVSGTSETFDQPLIDFLNNNFTNVTSVQYGDYSNPANIPGGTDVFMVGRRLSSDAYGNAANTPTFNALTIPVVSFTSYVTRPDGDRWGWHSGGVALDAPFDATGNETTVTAEGEVALGLSAGTYDFHDVVGSGDALGTGTVGGGSILATIEGNILAAGWTAGQLSAGGQAFGGNRLLWNVFQVTNTNSDTVMPDNLDGQLALRNAMETYTGLNAIPEPSTYAAIFGLVGLTVAILRRRKRSA